MDSETLEVYPGALMATVSASMSCAVFAEALLPHRLSFPPDPLDRGQTLAQLLSANRGGRRRLRYGTIANYLRGATLVGRQGSALDVGGQTVKNVTGYALPQLLAGSGDTLGAVSALTLTLRPLPRARRTCLLAFAQVEDACHASAAVLRDGAQPNCMALLDSTAQEQSGLSFHGERVGALLLVEYDGPEAALDRQTEHLTRVTAIYGGRMIVETDDPDAAAGCWRPWEALEHWLGSRRVGTLGLDLSLPRRELPRFAERASSLAHAYRMRLLLWGDAGVGNLHPILCWDPDESWRAAEAHQAALLLWQLAVSLGGTSAGERGNSGIALAVERGADPLVAELRARLVKALNPELPGNMPGII